MKILHELLDPSSRFESRFLNRDASGLVRPRLNQETLARIVSWYEDPRGGDGGRALLSEAPLFDAWLQGLIPNVDPEDPGAQQFQGAMAFMAGMVAGQWAREDMEGGVVEVLPDLTSSLGLFGIFFELPEAWGEAERTRGTQRLLDFHMRLTELDPALLAVHWALFHLAQHGVSHSLDLPERPGWCRFLFHAGQVAAGVEIPSKEELEELAGPLEAQAGIQV